MTAVKMAFGCGLPRSSSVGWFCSLASYSAETTTPQTVAVSPMWLAACSGLKGAAMAEQAQSPNAPAASGVTKLILTYDDAVRGTGDYRHGAGGSSQRTC